MVERAFLEPLGLHGAVRNLTSNSYDVIKSLEKVPLHVKRKYK